MSVWGLGLASLFDRTLPSDFNEFVKRTRIYIIQQELYLINPCRFFIFFSWRLGCLKHTFIFTWIFCSIWRADVEQTASIIWSRSTVCCVFMTQLVAFWTDRHLRMNSGHHVWPKGILIYFIWECTYHNCKIHYRQQNSIKYTYSNTSSHKRKLAQIHW